MKKTTIISSIVFAGVAMAASCASAAPQAKKARFSTPRDVPELMTAFDGKKIATVGEWEKIRRPEMLECLEKNSFGVRPGGGALDPKRTTYEIRESGEVLGGKAVREVVKATYSGPKGEYSFEFVSVRPKTGKPVPVLVAFLVGRRLVNPAETASFTDDSWPVDDIVARGFATVAISKNAIAPDIVDAGKGNNWRKCFKEGIFPAVEDLGARNDSSWAAISSWAWGNSRIMDWIETRPGVFDTKHVAIIGHSRGGKTALWTGATDTRFAMVCSVQSGCGGAKLNHISLPRSESIAVITKNFPHWFCKNYNKFRGKEMTMPFDQHFLAALTAPRLLVISSATEDAWAGQLGEWWTASLASPAWELYGKKGLVAEKFPAPETPQFGGSVGYFIRTGKHSLTRYEWARYMDFAEKHGWKKGIAKQ